MKLVNIAESLFTNILIQVYLLYVTDFIFYNLFLPAQEWKNIFTHKSSTSGIYQYFNSSVRRVKNVFKVLFILFFSDIIMKCYPTFNKNGIIKELNEAEINKKLSENLKP